MQTNAEPVSDEVLRGISVAVFQALADRLLGNVPLGCSLQAGARFEDTAVSIHALAMMCLLTGGEAIRNLDEATDNKKYIQSPAQGYYQLPCLSEGEKMANKSYFLPSSLDFDVRLPF